MYKHLKGTFEANNYETSKKYKCVFTKKEGNNVEYCATTLDDCCFVTTKTPEWISKQIKMLKDAYEVVKVEQGDELGLIGMQVKIDQENGRVILAQPNFVQSVIDAFKVKKGAPSPGMNDMMNDAKESLLLTNQKKNVIKFATDVWSNEDLS